MYKIIEKVNLETGEIELFRQKELNEASRFPVRGAKLMYPKTIDNMIDDLSPMAIKLLLKIIDRTNDRNIFNGKYSHIAKKIGTTRQYVSKLKKEIIDNGYAYEYKKHLFVSPFLVLPKTDPETQYKLQRFFKRLINEKVDEEEIRSFFENNS